ncbi:Aste57867_4757 [Aphanomyces stellatus]|uniref:Aste57867_4757 protein n=1 Tax=Aphanomyces stellatus TaxID=120398 RepID=A0A485KFX0_9STRA|nr:hypothetical protein As57867_004744 [Aphanomyces stellatus]VFT81853.1 Aste57867_4757 [Aphanomyces stellatus]
MAEDSASIDGGVHGTPPGRPAQTKKKGAKTSSQSKRTRSESNLGLKPTNKRKKAPAVNDDDDGEDLKDVQGDFEMETLLEKKQEILEELETYSKGIDLPSESPDAPPTAAALSRRNSLTTSTATSTTTTVDAATATFRHWDFLLQEMQWMATDFTQERKWRVRKAKTLSQSVTSYHNKKATATVRNLAQEEAARKRFAAKMGRDVKKFWLKIDKLVAHQVKVTEDERRKASMESQLRFLLQQTEKYASALASTFLLEHDDNDEDGNRVEPEATERRETSDDASDVDMHETTIDEEDENAMEVWRAHDEREPGEEEMEAEANTAAPGIGSRTKTTRRTARSDRGNTSTVTKPEVDVADSDFEIEDDVADDETTIEAEERAQSKTDVAAEVALLEEESTMSIEALRAKYAMMGDDNESDTSIPPSDDEFEVDAEDDDDDDDETSIALAEEAQSQADVAAEVALLAAESTISIEDLQAQYAAMEESDGDFEAEEDDDDDDETTIEAEEQRQSKADVDAEVALLEEESTMSIDALRAKYMAAMEGCPSSDEDDEEDSETREEPSIVTSDTMGTSIVPSDTNGFTTKDDVWQRVGLVRPFLLRHTLKLRAYQATGVAWLLSLAHNRMNGILADEMGLGKTIQTISLLASLATEGIWGPHLVIVPTSCILNWEMEFKRWCPGFKVMTYYGSAKRRKELRLGWSKVNAFQVCITSYQLVVADAPCFKRKKWYYLILDEAHNIKNWKSQRWQTLLTFNTQRRLLLTGTPLQNNLMELWALMHFLMPHLFRSRAQFSHWFNNPLNAMVEGETAVNDHLVSRLHNIIRPFVLRRLKKDVAKQMPGKFEHIVMCSLSKRQRYLYEDFMARSSTRKALHGGNFMGMMNVLMQLRKVCNHPDLFEPRPIMSPLDMPPLRFYYPFAFSTFHSTKERQLRQHGLVGSEVAATRRRQLVPSTALFVDDVSLPEPPQEAAFPEPLLFAFLTQQHALRHAAKEAKVQANAWLNHWRCLEEPFLSLERLRVCTMPTFISHAMEVHQRDDECALKSMVKTPTQRLDAWLEVLTKILCFVYKARTTAAELIVGSSLSAGRVQDELHWRETETEVVMQTEPLRTRLHPINQRHHLFFPDKRLIQFDCGKLQQLDRLLRELKRGNHRCLIFSQMSSMLNILEIFLNVHGHTYFRLDGSTPVERRQRLMDKFNSDPKVFCFILSTRSGGLGINLTGADTVIFYDSDWNPAMDAQAQDRAHRIGQTRDVHIYRMVSEHTVEENILRKAQQKRHLDFLVLSEGQFTTDYFTKSNLRAMIGKTTDEPTIVDDDGGASVAADEPDASTIEDAMAQCEDQEDVAAMKVVRQEQRVEKEQDETFDDDESVSNESTTNGPDAATALLDFNLRPIDNYAMGFRTTSDPLFHYVALPEHNDEQEEIELERIEAAKIVDEEMAIQEGDLIAAEDAMEFAVQKKLFFKERSLVKLERRRRAMTGASWQLKTCIRSNLPFYYNTDTLEAVWDRPSILIQNEEHDRARAIGYAGLSPTLLGHIMGFGSSLDRTWTRAAQHSQFHVRVHTETENVAGLLAGLQRGDVVVFGSGVHHITSPLHIYQPVRMMAATTGGTCTVEFQPGADLVWHAKGGDITGLHFQKDATTASTTFQTRSTVLTIMSDATCTVTQCHIAGGDTCVSIEGGTGIFYDNDIVDAKGSGVVVQGGFVTLVACLLARHGRCGLTIVQGAGIVRRNQFERNARYGIRMLSGVQMAMLHTNQFINNGCGAMDVEQSHRRIFIRNNDIMQDTELSRPHAHEQLKLKDWIAVWVDTCAAPKPKPEKKIKKEKLVAPVDANLPPPPTGLGSMPMQTGDGLPTKNDAVVVVVAKTNNDAGVQHVSAPPPLKVQVPTS